MGPESYTDCYRERLSEVIERKRKGRKIEAPEAEPEPKPAEDLMAALQRTLANVRAGEDPRASPTAMTSDLGGAEQRGAERAGQREKIAGRTKMSKKELVEALSGE